MNQRDPFSSLFAPCAVPAPANADTHPWIVLLVDDEPDIHAVLSLTLQDLVVEGRPLQLLDASSAEEARIILSHCPDIALILLDVVMETERAGLELVRYIRHELDYRMVQIVLVTGQPGYAPEREVITTYEIDGYRLKSELSADKIFVTVYAALRTYQAMCDLDQQRRQLEKQAEILHEQQEKLIRNEEEMHQQNDELLATEEELRVQIAEYETSQAERRQAEDERIKLEGQLKQAQKMEAVGRLAGGVAHDFNNMLTIMLGHSQLALMKMDLSPEIHEHLMSIQNAANRSADLTRQLLAFARKQTIAPIVLDLNETVSGMLKMLQRLIGEDIRLSWKQGANLWPIKVDPSQIDQVLANLCVNARDAIADVGMITIESGNCVIDKSYQAFTPDTVAGEFVRLSVSDDGCGMDKETMVRIFEPFFTTKGIGQGTGLGLATVYGIVKQNDGFINVYSEPGMGTTFRMYLPRHTGTVGGKSPEGATVAPAIGHETILLVEDEAAILELASMILSGQGYSVLAANGPGEAIRQAREHIGEIHLLVTDVVMPEMNGRDLAKSLLSLYPDMRRLFMSGYTANVIAHHGVLEKGVHFLQKPFSLSSLSAKVREVLDS